MTERNQHGQTHLERMHLLLERLEILQPCQAEHGTFGGRCLNCGWTPGDHKSTLISPRLDRYKDRQ